MKIIELIWTTIDKGWAVGNISRKWRKWATVTLKEHHSDQYFLIGVYYLPIVFQENSDQKVPFL